MEYEIWIMIDGFIYTRSFDNKESAEKVFDKLVASKYNNIQSVTLEEIKNSATTIKEYDRS